MGILGNGKDRIRSALLLAAGTGSRLQPLTEDSPKCLTEVNKTTILERLIHGLRAWEFERLVVVVGHLDSCVREYLDSLASGLTIEYVRSDKYLTTNNIYSLWEARHAIQEPFLLLECDLIFDDVLLGKMLVPDQIAVSRNLPWMNGTTITMDSLNRVTAFGMGRNGYPEDLCYKTVNIYSLSTSSWRKIAERLDFYILSGKVNEYYEVIFKEMIAAGSLSMEGVLFDPDRWYEIDTPSDLMRAEYIFGESDKGSEVC